MAKTKIKTPWQQRQLAFNAIIGKHMAINGIKTRKSLSEKSGFGVNAVSKWEKDIGAITLKRLVKLLDKLNVPIEERIDLLK